MAVKVFAVLKNSECARSGVRPGDSLISINGHEINDVLDYRFYSDSTKMIMCFEMKDGSRKNVVVKNSARSDAAGLAFSTYLMDKHRRCKNACIFCFIDQLPKGLRESLYFKDDDSRLSFLFGNYITLTNLTDYDVDRIIRMHISPVNASVHTMNPELRVKMMKNPFAGEALKYLKRLSDAGITINAQLVLCPGINDGDELRFSLEKLSELDSVRSVAAVPVGLTKFREGLYPLKKFDKSGAAEVIDIIDDFNAKLMKLGKDKLAYPSDEFFQLAERDIPEYSYYGDFPQLDNGVGMIACLDKEFDDALSQCVPDNKVRRIAVATGVAAYDIMSKVSVRFESKFPSSEIKVYCIKNKFFGEDVTVSGLITGTDLIDSLKTQGFDGPYLFIPSVMLKSKSEPIFLDDVSVSQVDEALNTRVVVTSCDAYSLFDSFFACCAD